MVHYSKQFLIVSLLALVALFSVVGQVAAAPVEAKKAPTVLVVKPQPVVKPVAKSKPAAKPAAKPKTVAKLAKTTVKGLLPTGSTKLIGVAKLSTIEIDEITDQLVMLLQSLKGYKVTSINEDYSFLQAPSGLIGDTLISRSGEGGNYVLRFGYRQFITQPPQFWVIGAIIGKDGNLSLNPDLDLFEPELKKKLEFLNEMRAGLTIEDLENRVIQLSHVDAASALTMLKGFGVTTGAVSAAVEFEKLPYVVKVEVPIDTDKDQSGAKGKPLSQLLIMFHPAHPEQLDQVSKVIQEYVDRPGSQIIIESKFAAKPKQVARPEAVGSAKMPFVKSAKRIVKKVLPEGFTKLIQLAKLNNIEINEISEQLVLLMQPLKGYKAISTALGDSLFEAPSGIIGDRMISRFGVGGTHVLQFGYRQFITQPPQFWVLGVIIGKDGNLAVNPDLAFIEPEVKKLLTSLKTMRAGLTVKDLDAKIIQLSYVDATNALAMLKGFGITTGAVPAKVDFAKLPFVINVEDPKSTYTGLVSSKGSVRGGNFGLSMSPGEASTMSDNAIGTPLTQLLVMFHPAHPEQFSRVRKVLDEYIDRPARQIFIEGMVLEISEQGLKDLGVKWSLNDYTKEDGTGIIGNLSGGSTSAGSDSDTLNVEIPNFSTLHNVFTGKFQWNWNIELRALVRQGKAQILSRPSILTLNNRQSTIRVGKDVPIASSLQGNNSNSISAFKFQYLSTGILLNIRPRINEDGSEVTMMIDTVVSAPVPNEDMEMRSADGETILAKAPTISTRRVQTYGRIANNTPLIIGGLVANEKVSIKDKVPLLGDIPMVGGLFRSEKTETEKREVIIVLTPHVLPDKKEIRRSYPKDEDFFDSFGHNLFRDSYRIRSEDVFDLTFLLDNEHIVVYRNLAREAAQKNFRLGEVEPYRSFVKDSIPGEPILVTRMIYEVVKRLNIEKQIEQSSMIYFGSQKVGGYNVEFFDKLVKGKGKEDVRDFGDKALAIIFHYDPKSSGSEPVPEVKEILCRDRDDWGTKLWELNQPDEDGCERHAILIKDGRDIVRLRRALAMKKISDLNGGKDQMRLKNFSVGKTLLMPELKNEQIYVIDSETARFFFYTEHYYASALKQIEVQLRQLDKELRRPEIKSLLDSTIPDEGVTAKNKREKSVEPD